MIDKFEQIHGAALLQVVKEGGGAFVSELPDASSRHGPWVLNGHTALFLKRSSGSNGEYQFAFSQENQADLKRIHGLFGRSAFTVLACGTCGFCPLTIDEFQDCTGGPINSQVTIKVRAPARGSFRVQGTAGRLKYTIPRSAWPARVLKGAGSQ